MIVKRGDYTILEKTGGQSGEGKPGGNGTSPIFKDTAQEMDDLPSVDLNGSGGIEIARNLGAGKILKGDAKEFTGGGKSKIFGGQLKKPNWKALTSAALSKSGNTLSDHARNLIKNLSGNEPTVDWRKELKKMFDATFNKKTITFPNRRHIASGLTLYGQKSAAKESLRTIICAVDTSGSIGNDQILTFVNEVMSLCKTFNADKTYIMYVSDKLHEPIDIVKKGGKPDFSLIKSTGGNACGFIPPFQYIEHHKINPSMVIYLTDTGGEMPDPKKYGISRYADRCIWFICSPKMYNPPSFGKVIYFPIGSIK